VYCEQRIFQDREKVNEWLKMIIGEGDGVIDSGDTYITYSEYDERYPVDISCMLVEVE
jgi:hypothetical protein